MIITSYIKLRTTGAGDIKDITSDVVSIVSENNLLNGIVTVFNPGSTGGLTTLEFEPGLLEDLPEFFEQLAPSNRQYKHDETWHDGNGFSHIRSALLGPGITVPVVQGRLALGTWQQIVFCEFDNKNRKRNLVVQLVGE